MSENKKFCRFCGKQLPIDAKFCSFCGKKLDDETVETEDIQIDTKTSIEEPKITPVAPTIYEKPKITPVEEPTEVEENDTDMDAAIEAAIKTVTTETSDTPVDQVDNDENADLLEDVEVEENETENTETTETTEDNETVEAVKPEKKHKPKQSDKLKNDKSDRYKDFEIDDPQKGGAGKVAIIILLVILLLIGGFLGGSYLFRNQLASSYPDGGFDLPFGYALEIPWIQEAKDALGEGDGDATEGGNTTVQTAQPTASTTTVTNETDALATALKAQLGDNPSDSDYATITSVYIDGENVYFNQTNTPDTTASKVGTINLESLSKCTQLKIVSVANVSGVSFPTSTIASVTDLDITNCDLTDPAATGINNFTNVANLKISKTNLNDLTNVSRIGSVKRLTVDENAITSVDPIKANMTNLEYCSITKNKIWDYRGLANVKSVDIWGKGSTNPSNVYTMERDTTSRQIQVLVIDLRIRSEHNANSENNVLDERAVQNAYYYILDEYWDESLKTTWYKIGNDMWIASKEGSWTKLFEN